jgi:hypothetical protein
LRIVKQGREDLPRVGGGVQPVAVGQEVGAAADRDRAVDDLMNQGCQISKATDYYYSIFLTESSKLEAFLMHRRWKLHVELVGKRIF